LFSRGGGILSSRGRDGRTRRASAAGRPPKISTEDLNRGYRPGISPEDIGRSDRENHLSVHETSYRLREQV
ncbi:MAG: hypothetical protein ACK5PZ_19100, partial [Pirellula sp.]